MMIGIEQFRDPAELRLTRMLLQPLRGAARPASVLAAPNEGAWDPAHCRRTGRSDKPASG
jgi:hypothetical protein